tara:strand:+ start:196 stop:516 length:321 start_codon:yes stop_codon:yes gene_type:complete
MKKQDVWNEEINPDFISDQLDNLNSHVWDRGYYKETEDGFWYEVYVNDQIKKYYPKIDLNDEEQKETFGKFDSIMLDHYESDNQITFFVPTGESTYTLAELTDILI